MAADDFRVDGADALLALGKRFKKAGQGEVLKRLNKANAQAVKPLMPASRKRALAILPSTGGLAKLVSKAPQRTTSRVGGTTASVRQTVAGKRSGAAGADKGRVRHKVFGRPGSWVTQDVEPGWFSDTVDDMKPKIQDDVTDNLVEFAKHLARPL